MVGAGEADEECLANAREVGRLLAEASAVTICGGLGGVMEGAADGASGAGGTVIGIVPGAEPGDANSHCTHVIAAATGSARNLAVVASAAAVIAVGGAWGTLSEIALARQLDRRVVALGSWAVEPNAAFAGELGILRADSPREAVHLALGG